VAGILGDVAVTKHAAEELVAEIWETGAHRGQFSCHYSFKLPTAGESSST